MDSTTMLYEYQERIAIAVSFDYGSNHNTREIACAKTHAVVVPSPATSFVLTETSLISSAPKFSNG